ncbi:MAG TPA: hypothetical protein VGX48_20520 [Pyrinomonadaceae bacterium]|jgi:hypothetical protein|nr:hypothetical protein [Pyrinomonadaceae bacterium]
MKHRSIGAFLLLAATLFAIPQAVEDIRSLKGSVLGRARGELLQAILSFNSDEATPAPPSSRQARTALASCPEAAKQNPAVASAAKKASPRAASAVSRGESPDESELSEFVAEEAEGPPLPFVAEFVGELAEAVHEVAEVKVPAAPLPRAVGGAVTLPASVKGERKGTEGRGRAQWVSAHELSASESAALDRLKAQQDYLKVELLKESDLARALGAQRVRQFRVIRRRPSAPPAPTGGELPTQPKQAADTAEADAAAAGGTHGSAWASEKQ